MESDMGGIARSLAVKEASDIAKRGIQIEAPKRKPARFSDECRQ